MKKVHVGPTPLVADGPPRAPRLDMRSVRTPYQERASPASSTPPPPPASTTPKDPPSHQTTSPLGSASASSPPPPTTPRNRHFGLPEAPVFYPTPEEFANPLQYIEKIRPLAEHAGLCKIIPPAQWAPTFALDTEVFRFHTRKQQLNSLEGKTRANLNYLEQLYKFHAQQGNPGMKVPQLAKKPIDLYSLKKEVDQRGGYLKVTAAKKWAEIGRVLNYHRASCTSLSNSLKKAYTNIVLPYELYLAKVKKTEPTTPGQPPTTATAATTTSSSTTPRRDLASHSHGRDGVPLSPPPPPPLPLTGTTPLTAVTPKREDELRPGSPALSVMSERSNDTSDTLHSSSGGPTDTITPRRSKRRKVGGTPGDEHGGAKSPALPPHPPPKVKTATPAVSTTTTTPRRPGRPRIHFPAPVKPDPKKEVEEVEEPTKKATNEGVEETAEKDEDDDADEGADAQSDSCQICHSSEKGEQMLLCDGCDHGFHLYCLDPPLSKVPRTDWYCLQCILQAGGDFGFEDGGEYSLHAFQKKCNTFKKNWFASYFDSPAGAAVGDTTDELVEGKVPEQVVEAEFWRLVESPYEAVEVEYGADLHSMQHGSAFPTKERNPLDPYSLDPWNLNVIPILPQSLFSFIKSDISGMMNPWLYVGMCFSTFCWHNEDHYTYSINYMHWGDTKTWYGIPGAAADQFERAIQRAVPELFEQQPDLLFQLVTMLSPGTLRQSGVDVYALDQRPGQFVVTFPKSYHAGFNHGFNFAEAVNFATPDWVPFGLDSVRRYQEYQRLPVFSHDELLWTIASYTQSTEVAEWLHHHMTQLRDRELLDRAAVRQRGLVSSTVARSGKDEERPPALPAPDEENQCCHCKAFSYLSAVTCNCTTRISCLQHWEQLCDCPPSARHVELRYSDHQLCELTDKIVSLATVSKKWVRRFRQLMLSGSFSPSLSTTTTTAPTSPTALLTASAARSPSPSLPPSVASSAAERGGGVRRGVVVPTLSYTPIATFKPHLLLMCQLLVEAALIPSVIHDARVLQLFVGRVLTWVREAHQFLRLRYPTDLRAQPTTKRRRGVVETAAAATPSNSGGAAADQVIVGEERRSGRRRTAASSAPTAAAPHRLTPAVYLALYRVPFAPMVDAEPPRFQSTVAAMSDDPALLELARSFIPAAQGSKPTTPAPATQSLNRLDELLTRAENLAFDAPEIHLLRELRQRVLDYHHELQSFLVRLGDLYLFQPSPPTFTLAKVGDPHRLEVLRNTVAALDRIIERGLALPVYVPELAELQGYLGGLQWSLRAQTAFTRAASALHADPTTLTASWFEFPDKLSFDEFIGLLEEAVEGHIQSDNCLFVALLQVRSLGQQWGDRAQEFLDKTEVTLEEVQEILRDGFHLLPFEPPVYTKIQHMGKEFSHLLAEANSAVARTKHRDVTKRPLMASLRSLLEQFDQLYLNPPAFRPPVIGELKDDLAQIDSWILRGKKLFARGNMPKKWVEMLLEVEEAVKRCTHSPPALSLAYTLGTAGAAETNEFLSRSATGKPRPLLSSLTEYNPHQHPNESFSAEHRRRRDSAGSSSSSLYCVCRQPEQGFMVECDICHEWYHGGCLKISRRETKALSYFVCPICDPAHVDMPHPTKRPSLETLIAHAQEGEKLPFVTQELDPLVTIILDMSRFRSAVLQALELQKLIDIPGMKGTRPSTGGKTVGGAAHLAPPPPPPPSQLSRPHPSYHAGTSATSPSSSASASPSASSMATNSMTAGTDRRKSPTPLGLLALYQALIRRCEGVEVSLPYEEADLRKLTMYLRLAVRPDDRLAREWIQTELSKERPRIKQQLDNERRQQQNIRGGLPSSSSTFPSRSALASPPPTSTSPGTVGLETHAGFSIPGGGNGHDVGGVGGGNGFQDGAAAPFEGPTVIAGPHRIPIGQKLFDGSALYCLCQQPFDPQQAMIACDTCRQWFHLECVHVPVLDACRLDQYQCPVCAVRLGVPYAFGEIMVVDDPPNGDGNVDENLPHTGIDGHEEDDEEEIFQDVDEDGDDESTLLAKTTAPAHVMAGVGEGVGRGSLSTPLPSSRLTPPGLEEVSSRRLMGESGRLSPPHSTSALDLMGGDSLNGYRAGRIATNGGHFYNGDIEDIDESNGMLVAGDHLISPPRHPHSENLGGSGRSDIGLGINGLHGTRLGGGGVISDSFCLSPDRPRGGIADLGLDFTDPHHDPMSMDMEMDIDMGMDMNMNMSIAAGQHQHQQQHPDFLSHFGDAQSLLPPMAAPPAHVQATATITTTAQSATSPLPPTQTPTQAEAQSPPLTAFPPPLSEPMTDDAVKSESVDKNNAGDSNEPVISLSPTSADA
ncbi:hypothetical protein H4R33_004671 [Dimargaris cristalligena]|nr:hypothetical protein H4R33_004671 [Dimargaris cristalligena]